jgi:hypothetical protein
MPLAARRGSGPVTYWSEVVDARRMYHPADFGDQQWSRLLEYALGRADTFRCVTPYRVVLQTLAAPFGLAQLDEFRGVLIERYASLIRWDVEREEPVEFLQFDVAVPEAESLRRYIRAARRLEEWSWAAGRPEDPTFLLRGVPILSTESVGGRIAVFANDTEASQLVSDGIRLLEPLGVKAEPWPTP